MELAQQELDASLHIEEIQRRRVLHIPGGRDAKTGHHHGQPVRFLRQLISDRLEDGPDLEHGDRLCTRIFLGDFQHRGKQASAHHAALRCNGIGKLHIFSMADETALTLRRGQPIA